MLERVLLLLGVMTEIKSFPENKCETINATKNMAPPQWPLHPANLDYSIDYTINGNFRLLISCKSFDPEMF